MDENFNMALGEDNINLSLKHHDLMSNVVD
jgi:hypothetical protein